MNPLAKGKKIYSDIVAECNDRSLNPEAEINYVGVGRGGEKALRKMSIAKIKEQQFQWSDKFIEGGNWMNTLTFLSICEVNTFGIQYPNIR